MNEHTPPPDAARPAGTPSPSPSPGVAPLAIDSRAAFHAALPAAWSWSAARNARQLWLSDPDFAEWPLDDPAWLDALTAFVRQPLRQLTLLADRFEGVRTRHPRFTAWRRTWAHAVQAWSPAENGLVVPTLLVDDGPVVLVLQDGERWRGRALRDAHEARQARDRLDALLQRCEPAFAPSQLGL